MLVDLGTEIARLLIAALRASRALRIVVAMMAGFFFLVSASLVVAGVIFRVLPVKDDDAGPLAAILFGIGLAFSGSVALATLSDTHGLSRQNAELEPILTERKEIQERLSHQREPNIFDTIQLNLNQLNEYYTINKAQARRSFAASLFAIIAGLIVMLSTIGTSGCHE